ncbi:MAG: AmmeMemoRadiSam system radical SAM enzyme [Planctomycetota bacterium]
MATLETNLRARAAPAAPELTEVLENDRVRCLACGHRCRIPPGKRGVCKVRWNEAGTLMAPRGYVAGLAVDPIEKKPFYHVLPGSDALSFGMLGCDFHCSYCQNWLTSQALRDDAAGAPVTDVTAREIVDAAMRNGAPVVTSTYNEPMITADWAAEVFDIAKERGLLTSFVSNGNGTPEVLDFLAPRLDLMKVDLKSFRPESYRELGGVLDHVLATIESLVDRRIWVEVVTLVVPGFNDGDDELAEIASFLAGLSADLPWHVTAFHPDYRMRDPRATPPETLIRAHDIGRAAGLSYVYPGNRAGAVGDRENTKCPGCGAVLVTRTGYFVGEVRVTAAGTCPDCGHGIAGRFGD